jgi:hypothetical protein
VPVEKTEREIATIPADRLGHRRKTAIETSSSILRDARSAGSGLSCQFGLMADDYTPKPACHAYRGLIRQM